MQYLMGNQTRDKLERFRGYGGGDPDERTWLRDEIGGSVYLRLTTKPLEQPGQRHDDACRQGAIDGAYWLRPPGPNCSVVIAYQGAVADVAIAAAGQIGEHRHDVAVLAVTSADRLSAGWSAAQRERARGNHAARSHIETLLNPVQRDCVKASGNLPPSRDSGRRQRQIQHHRIVI